MKINFQEIKMYSGIAHTDACIVDVREQFADMVYRNMNGIAGLELARKIYSSEGTIEYSEKEVDMISYCKDFCTPQFIEALNLVMKD